MIELEISYKKGRADAGYLHLRAYKGLAGWERWKKGKRLQVGIVLEFVEDSDQLMGIEILAFNEEVVARIETALVESQIPFESSDLAPILRA